MYDIGGYLLLHSGRLVPDSGNRVERNEGVGINCVRSRFGRDMEEWWGRVEAG